jgi:hypothetical protein
VTITRKDKNAKTHDRRLSAERAVQPPTLVSRKQGGVFGQKRKYHPKDGAIFLLLLFVVVSGERTMLYRCGRGKKTDIVP